MKTFSKLLILLLLVSIIAGCLAACGNDTPDNPPVNPDNGPGEFVDYASTVKFDPDSGRLWEKVTVKQYVDGDTTHFNVPKSVLETGVLKARYLAVNTPESTGQIEPWGKKASNYTKDALKGATDIIIESNSNSWNPDSTGDRYLVWVWYKGAGDTDYRNLNLELLQQGLARSSKASDTCYAEICNKIFTQAVNHKLYVHSKDKDPDFYYGSARPITLRELKTNIDKYTDTKVSFEAVVTRIDGKTAYVEEYDEELDIYYGIQIFFGYNLGYAGEEILSIGNRVRIVGSVQYYEVGGYHQISDIYYHEMRPDDESNIKLISSGHTASFKEYTVADLLRGSIDIDITTVDENDNEIVQTKSYKYGYLSLHGTVSVKNLTIKEVYTTTKEDSANKGALSITCEDEFGNEIVVRTIVLKDSTGKIITADAFPIGSRINVKGLVDYFNGDYQVKVFTLGDVTFIND